MGANPDQYRPNGLWWAIVTAMRTLIRAIIFLGSAALGLVIAGWLVPGVGVGLSGFLVAVVVFALAQSLITPLTMKLTNRYSPALVGGAGLISTAVALFIATLFPNGLTINGALAWTLGTLVVWLVTALGGWLLPLWLLKNKAADRN